jgi:hypothetical protein
MTQYVPKFENRGSPTKMVNKYHFILAIRSTTNH